jgi:hypothetical protein
MRIEVEIDGRIEVVSSRIRLVSLLGEAQGGGIWDASAAAAAAEVATLSVEPSNDTDRDGRFVDIPVYGIRCT